MRPYEPNIYTAISIYMVATVHHFKATIIAHPGMSNVEETTPGRFLIRTAKEHDDRIPFVSEEIVCTYNPDTALWYVELPDGEVLVVRDEDDWFTVVWDSSL